MIQLASQSRVTTLSKPLRHYVLHATRYFEALTGTLILNLPPEAICFGGVFFSQITASKLGGWSRCTWRITCHSCKWFGGACCCTALCCAFALVTGRDRCNDQCRHGWHQISRHGWDCACDESKPEFWLWNHVTAYHFAIVSFRLITLLLTKSFSDERLKVARCWWLLGQHRWVGECLGSSSQRRCVKKNEKYHVFGKNIQKDRFIIKGPGLSKTLMLAREAEDPGMEDSLEPINQYIYIINIYIYTPHIFDVQNSEWLSRSLSLSRFLFLFASLRLIWKVQQKKFRLFSMLQFIFMFFGQGDRWVGGLFDRPSN